MKYLILLLALAGCVETPDHLGAWEAPTGTTITFVDDSTAIFEYPRINAVDEVSYTLDYSRTPHWFTAEDIGKAILTVSGDSLWLTISKGKDRRPLRHLEEPLTMVENQITVVYERR